MSGGSGLKGSEVASLYWLCCLRLPRTDTHLPVAQSPFQLLLKESDLAQSSRDLSVLGNQSRERTRCGVQSRQRNVVLKNRCYSQDVDYAQIVCLESRVRQISYKVGTK